jgi:hypothetical protein
VTQRSQGGSVWPSLFNLGHFGVDPESLNFIDEFSSGEREPTIVAQEASERDVKAPLNGVELVPTYRHVGRSLDVQVANGGCVGLDEGFARSDVIAHEV